MQQRPWGVTQALTNATNVNLVNPGTTTGGVNSSGTPYGNMRIIITHIRAMNKTTASHSLALWKGATGAQAAGTEFAFPGIAAANALVNGVTIPGNSYLDWYGRMPFDVGDFLVGGADANTAITLEIEGEIGVA